MSNANHLDFRSPARVLDGDALNAMATELMLKDLGVAAVHTTVSISVAIALIEINKVDLVIVDLDSSYPANVMIVERLFAEHIPTIFSSASGGEIFQRLLVQVVFCASPIQKKTSNASFPEMSVARAPSFAQTPIGCSIEVWDLDRAAHKEQSERRAHASPSAARCFITLCRYWGWRDKR